MALLGRWSPTVLEYSACLYFTPTADMMLSRRRTKRWEAHIWDDKKQVYLGGFDVEEHAGAATLIPVPSLINPSIHSE